MPSQKRVQGSNSRIQQEYSRVQYIHYSTVQYSTWVVVSGTIPVQYMHCTCMNWNCNCTCFFPARRVTTTGDRTVTYILLQYCAAPSAVICTSSLIPHPSPSSFTRVLHPRPCPFRSLFCPRSIRIVFQLVTYFTYLYLIPQPVTYVRQLVLSYLYHELSRPYTAILRLTPSLRFESSFPASYPSHQNSPTANLLL